MSDPLNFFTTTLEPVQTPKDDIINIMPLAPLPTPSFNIGDQTAQSEQPDWANMLEIGLNQLPKSNVAYTFSEAEKKRYNNPTLSYIPADRLVNAADIEDLYNINQARGKQLMNGFLKAGANAAGTFVSTFLTIPEQIDLFRNGQVIEAFQNDSMFSGVQEWLKGLEDTLPNYYSAAERDNPWKGIVPFTDGSANFWGDKIIKNIGFSMGALASGVLIDAGITAVGSAVTGGAYAPLGVAKTLNNIRRFGSNMYRGMRNTIKATQTIQGANALGRSFQTGANLIEAARTLSHAQALSKIPRWATTTYLTAQGESFIEGYHNYVDIKSKEIEDALRNNKPIDPGLEDRAMAAGKYTTMMNLPIIMTSNMLQFSNVLYGAKAALRVPRSFISTISDGALSVANNYTFKKGMIEFLKSTGKNFVPEFIEEGSQVLIGNSVLDYYSDKKNYESKQSVLGYVMSQIPNVMADKDFWFEGTIGGITGALMGAGSSMRYLTRGRQDTQDIVDNMNPVLQRFNGLVKNFTHNIQLNNSIDERVKQDVQFKSMYSVVSDNSRQGTYDIFKDSIEDLKDLELDQFNLAFGTEFKTDADKIQHLQSILNQADNIKANVDLANEMYSENPYVAKSTLGQFVKKLFPDANQNQLAYFFEEFKENIGYTMSRLQHTKEREGQINTYFREILDTRLDGENIQSVLGYFTTLSRTGNRKPYMAWKNVQLEGLREQLEYYNELEQNTKLTRDVKAMKKSIENRIKEITTHLEKVNTLEGDELMLELFTENASAGSIEDFKTKVDEYSKLKSEQENLEEEAQDPDSVARNTVAAEKAAQEIARQNTKQPVAGEEDSEEVTEEEIEEDDDVEYIDDISSRETEEAMQMRNSALEFIKKAKKEEIEKYFENLYAQEDPEFVNELINELIITFEQDEVPTSLTAQIIAVLKSILNKNSTAAPRPPSPPTPPSKPPAPAAPAAKPAQQQTPENAKGRQGFNGIGEIIFSNPNFKIEGFEIDGNYWNVITNFKRAKVLININGVIVPFYLTSGKGGKDLIPGWYPFFGIGDDGWLNKTNKSDMETYYERYWGKEAADIVRSISNELNNFYGTDPTNFENDKDPNEPLRPINTLLDKVEDYINSKLSYTPAINDENARKILRSNIEKLGKEINAKYDAEQAQQQSAPTQQPTISIIWSYQDIVDYFNTKGNEKKSLKVIEGSMLSEPKEITLKLKDGQVYLVKPSSQNPKKNTLEIYTPLNDIFNPYYEVDSAIVKPGDPNSEIITNNIRQFMGEDYLKYPSIALTLSQTKLFTVKC